MSSPKEKAKELVEKFKNRSVELGHSHSQLLAEANALIAVDQVIEMLDVVCESKSYDPFEAPMYDLKEWKQIKEEIENL